MATNTYIALDKKTVSSAVSSVQFTGISSAYTDLIIVVSGYMGTGSGAYIAVQFNGDTGSNYSATDMSSNGSTAQSARFSSQTSGLIGAFYGTPGVINCSISNYANTSIYKNALSQSNAPSNNVRQDISMWRNTAAITSVTVLAQTDTFATGTTFSLYGVTAWAAQATPKATGGYVYSDSSYWYHAFPFTSTFTPNQSLTCDYLVVAGGGGGGNFRAGGGGAGGLRSTITATGGGGSLESALSVTAQAYTITVGAGGAGGIGDNGTNGGNSTFFTITSTGGGGGAGQNVNDGVKESGNAGGSGGGSFKNTNTSIGDAAGGTGTANQGYAGGTAVNAAAYVGSGGGGAGAVGSDSVYNSEANIGGSGGAGVSISTLSSITATGVNGYYAGGGGGGAYGRGGIGGLGGGGRGCSSDTNNGKGFNAVVSTGSGGGGGGSVANPALAYGGNGGSGIVIIRYAK